MITREADIGQVVIVQQGRGTRRVQILGRPKRFQATYRGFFLGDAERPRRNLTVDTYINVRPEDIVSVEEGKYDPGDENRSWHLIIDIGPVLNQRA